MSALSVWHLRAAATTLLISSGPAGDVSFQIGEVLATILEDAFPGFPEGKDLDFANTSSGGSVDNVLRVFNGQAHLGLAEEGIELDQKPIRTSGGSSSTAPGQPQAEARTLVQLFSSPLKIVVRRDLGRQAGVAPPPLRLLSDLASLTDRRRTQRLPPFKISIGMAGSGTRKVARLVLDQYGLTASPDPSREDGADFAILGHDWTIKRVRQALQQGEIDVAFFLTAFGTGELRDLALQGGFVLLGIDRAEGIHRSHPFLDVVRIPAASYPSSGKFPETDIETLAAGEILIGSSLLSDQQAYRIVESIFNHSHNLGSAFPFMPPLSKTDQLAERFYYPPHPGASAFYQGRHEPQGLLDFLQRYRDTMLGVAGLFSFCGTVWAIYHFWAGRWRSRPLLHRLHHAAAPEHIHALESEVSHLYAKGKINRDTYECLKEYARVRLKDVRRQQSRS